MVNHDGSINSNYGYHIFGEVNQYDVVIKKLVSDKDSRQATMMILNSEHLKAETKDVPCTYSINFRIRENKLNMTVRMRSQDAIYGFGNDIPTFSFIHEMLLNSLQEFYPELQYGLYHHSVDSFHIYEKHFKMIESIINDDEFIDISCPEIFNSDEVKFLRKYEFDNIPSNFIFTRWLTNYESKDNNN